MTDSQQAMMSAVRRAASDVPIVVDFIDKACRPHSDRSHAPNEPNRQRSSEFGGGDDPDTERDYAGRDQICGEPFHARHLSRAATLRLPAGVRG
jgi:hypothetical protein